MFASEDQKIANEQIKVVANFLNTLAAASMILGFLTPIFAIPERLDGGLALPVLAFLTSITLATLCGEQNADVTAQGTLILDIAVYGILAILFTGLLVALKRLFFGPLGPK